MTKKQKKSETTAKAGENGRKKTGRGGKREGAGRKPIGPEPTEARSISATPAQWNRWKRAARKAGTTLSAWVRRAADKEADNG